MKKVAKKERSIGEERVFEDMRIQQGYHRKNQRIQKRQKRQKNNDRLNLSDKMGDVP